MTLIALDHIAGLFYQVFGTPILIAILFLGLFTIMMLLSRANIYVAAAILLPVIGYFTFSATDHLGLPREILILFFFVFAVIIALFYLMFQR